MLSRLYLLPPDIKTSLLLIQLDWFSSYFSIKPNKRGLSKLSEFNTKYSIYLSLHCLISSGSVVNDIFGILFGSFFLPNCIMVIQTVLHHFFNFWSIFFVSLLFCMKISNNINTQNQVKTPNRDDKHFKYLNQPIFH